MLSGIWFDVDRPDLDDALKDTRMLVAFIEERYRPGDDDLLIFFSGSKGFHVGIPTCLWSPAPSEVFHKTARRFAEAVAEKAGVTIDLGVYDKVRAFRAPNSRHPKTGLHKRHLSVRELVGLSLERIIESAKEPEPFDLPEPTRTSSQAAADWQTALDAVAKEAAAKTARDAARVGKPKLNRLTLEFIRNGAEEGDRHRYLFSSARNLAECGCPLELAHALLEESALDSGLCPKDVGRQIVCGFDDAAKTVGNPVKSGADGPSQAAVSIADVLSQEGDATWESADSASVSPSPPPGAKFWWINEKGRSCDPADCHRWTWEGNSRWYDAKQFIPPGAEKENEKCLQIWPIQPPVQMQTLLPELGVTAVPPMSSTFGATTY